MIGNLVYYKLPFSSLLLCNVWHALRHWWALNVSFAMTLFYLLFISVISLSRWLILYFISRFAFEYTVQNLQQNRRCFTFVCVTFSIRLRCIPLFSISPFVCEMKCSILRSTFLIIVTCTACAAENRMIRKLIFVNAFSNHLNMWFF